jgi:hypothetical protein
VIYAGAQGPSFRLASEALQELAALSVAAKQVERLTQQIGRERCVERDAAVQAYQERPLVERKAAPAGVTAPPLAVVQMDGGRLQILDRSATAAPAVPAASHWREDKVGLLATMSSQVSLTDPCPTIPDVFVDAPRMQKLTREIKGAIGVTAEEAAAQAATAAPAETPATPVVYESPELEQRSVVATKEDAHVFDDLLAQAAWARGFYGAERRAFVGDGSSTNWGVWERKFSNFEPITDFIHALTYVFAGAMAGRSFAAGWPVYRAWIGDVWAGRLEPVLAGLAARQAELGVAGPEDAETSPRQQVARALEYLHNQRGRMQYAQYRQQGLPITSSHIESTIKQINQRVKGTEKFWSEPGAEAILQLRADYLSETAPLCAFWERRQAAATGERRYSNTL